MSPAEGVALIHRAGGLAVQAHPEEVGNRELVRSLLATLPYDGVEIWHPSADGEAQAFWRQEAARRGLLVTGGSDFHGNAGRFPDRLGLWKVSVRSVQDILRRFGLL